ncbi:MAG: xanthine phosphoribosyltransferase [Alphaproteobacteria bacterium]
MTATFRVREISWAEFHGDCLRLARRVEFAGNYQGIVAVSRGGLVPAAVLATCLDIRKVETISVASYEGSNRGEVRLLKEAPAAGDGEGWLVVDDLVDSGATARTVRSLLPRARYVVVYAKSDGEAVVDDYGVLVEPSEWLRFPWEGNPSG